MSIASLTNILKIFGGGEPTAEERNDLVKETVLLTLARASAADSNIKHIEIETVRDVVEKTTGEHVTAHDVRMAAHSRLYESAPLERHLASVARKVNAQDRAMIAGALADVILSDGRVSSREVGFYNMVAEALSLTPAEIAGLFEST